MRLLFIPVFMLLVFQLMPLRCISQAIDPRLLESEWDAQWIAVPQSSPDDYGVYNFRKTIDLAEKPASFIVHVSGDNRYKFFVNGELACLGPARGDLARWRFESVDIAPYLTTGRNILTAIVWNIGKGRPEAQISYRTGFILQGNDSLSRQVNTNDTWKCESDDSYEALPPQLLHTYYVCGPGDRVDHHKKELGWQRIAFDDSGWKKASPISQGAPKGVFTWSEGWMLVPRDIPLMEVSPLRLHSVRTASGVQVPRGFPAQATRFTIPPGTKATLLLDQRHLTNAYPVVRFSKGDHASVTLSYAEALYIDEGPGDWRAQKQKGNRNEVDGKRFVGVSDQVISDGSDDQRFSPLWWRTYRYLQLEVETKAEALTVEDIYGLFTGYPFERKANFSGPTAEWEKILDVGWRTARLCAAETYMDCPYYEQLQYVGDTRIQALVSLYNAGDDRLMRNAITQLDQSRVAEGITLSRYPTNHPQKIPPFSLWWIGMVHDYWMYRDDTAFVQDKLPGIRQVLHWFHGFQEGEGGLKNPQYWNFTDWARENGWERGVPPKGEDGASSVLDLQLLWAYQLAAELEGALGSAEHSNLYTARASSLAKHIRDRYWDERRGLFADTAEKNFFSQHANTLAVLTGLVTGAKAVSLMEKVFSDTTLTQATIYFKYYVHLAGWKVGMGDNYPHWLGDWRNQLDNGLTTWAEISDVNNARSDCHAWGSSPNLEVFRIVLGIDAAAPGFRKVKIAPSLGTLTKVSGSIPHPKGMIAAAYEKGPKNWTVKIVLPEATDGTFVWEGKSYPLSPGMNRFTL